MLNSVSPSVVIIPIQRINLFFLLAQGIDFLFRKSMPFFCSSIKLVDFFRIMVYTLIGYFMFVREGIQYYSLLHNIFLIFRFLRRFFL